MARRRLADGEPGNALGEMLYVYNLARQSFLLGGDRLTLKHQAQSVMSTEVDSFTPQPKGSKSDDPIRDCLIISLIAKRSHSSSNP
jgi:hypothetical protein